MCYQSFLNVLLSFDVLYKFVRFFFIYLENIFRKKMFFNILFQEIEAWGLFLFLPYMFCKKIACSLLFSINQVNSILHLVVRTSEWLR